MSGRRRPPTPELGPIAKVRRALGLRKVRGLALKLLQQQLQDLQDRRLDAGDRAFVIDAVRALFSASKQGSAPFKDAAAPISSTRNGVGDDPLERLGG